MPSTQARWSRSTAVLAADNNMYHLFNENTSKLFLKHRIAQQILSSTAGGGIPAKLN